MKINNVENLENFMSVVRKAKGDIYLRSAQGDQYNLKSTLSAYIGLGAMLKNEGNDLELFCQLREDEPAFMELFTQGVIEN